MRKKTSAAQLAKMLNVSEARAAESIIKAQLISAVIKEVKAQNLTHAELAKKTKIPRSAVTGILSGSLQKITIDRVLRLVDAVGLVPQIKLVRAA